MKMLKTNLNLFYTNFCNFFIQFHILAYTRNEDILEETNDWMRMNMPSTVKSNIHDTFVSSLQLM